MPSIPSRRIAPGQQISAHDLVSVTGEPVEVPGFALVHLQFRRFAGCPVCNLHLQSFARRHAEIAAAGIREVVVFHSTAEELRPHTAGLPFAVIADPQKRLYAEFGVESSVRALLDPRVWPVVVRSVMASLVVTLRERRPIPSLNPEGGRFGLPADFLIDADGRVLACKYGEHAGDHWSVDELLAIARDSSSARREMRTRLLPTYSRASR